MEWNSEKSNMAPMHVRLKVALAGVVLSTSIVSAQQAVRPGTAAAKVARQSAKAAAQRAAKDIRSLINGVAIDSDQTPLPNATIRLRNLEDNTDRASGHRERSWRVHVSWLGPMSRTWWKSPIKPAASSRLAM